jgi:NAD(P)-dependent dehydrogenase (short-subunit alcohol dehydrogenase family)
MADLDGRVVAITGASRGLGAALAMAFARAGARVAGCARHVEGLAPVRREVEAAGGRCHFQAVDVSDPEDVDGWLDAVEATLGPPSVVVNNASILGPREPLADFPLDVWRTVIEINLTGTLVVTQRVLRSMRGQGSGSIINVSSGAALPPRTGWGAYAVSKDALEGLSLNLAREMSGTGIRINIVDPGAMRTDMRAAAYPEEDPGTVKEPGSIAPLFLWLASDAAREVSGERFQADAWLREQSHRR